MNIQTVCFSCILWLAGTYSTVHAQMTIPGQGSRANIIVILADDLGYGDVGAQHQSKDVVTPNIDSIAKNGMRFTQGYDSAPVCGPSRAGLLTGRYQNRFGYEVNPDEIHPEKGEGLPLEERTIGDAMQDCKYVTGAFGKWHMGHNEEQQPLKRGFNEFFGFLGGGHVYFPAQSVTTNETSYTRPIYLNHEIYKFNKDDYLTDVLTDQAISFIDCHEKEPFFVYLAYNAIHVPLQAKLEDENKFSSIVDDKRRRMVAMLYNLDVNVGRILKKINDSKLDKKTLIVFLSDNGGISENGSLNTPLRGVKNQTFEGGPRVPFFMQWKGVIPVGSEYPYAIVSRDILPTCVAIAGGKIPKNLDGVDLLPYIMGINKERPHDELYWRLFWGNGNHWSSVLKGDWKLVVQSEKIFLFNLAEDMSEKVDLSLQNPEKVKELQADFERWEKEMKPPAWLGPMRGQNLTQLNNL
jgi:arylsulfatase A-like enzyme